MRTWLAANSVTPVDLGLTALVGLLLWVGGVWSPGQGWPELLLGAAQVLPLLLRRRAPGVVLAVVTAATVAQLLIGLPRNLGYVPVLLALYSAQGSPHRAVRWWLCGVAAVAVGLVMVPTKGPVEGTLLTVVVAGVAWAMGLERRRHLAERGELARYRAAEQRERAARRLHDTMAQTTTVMLVHAEALRAVGELSEADRARLDTILTAGRAALSQVREAVRELHEDGAPADPCDLPEVLRLLTSAGLVLDGDPLTALAGLDAPARELAERVVAESATNALRHAGPGAVLRVRIIASADSVLVDASNTAGRKSLARTGYGLSSLAGQLSASGGELDCGPVDGGWRVTARIPVPATARR
ncbi:sensor histidine kinase [Kutzneria albida]|uniref:histidine kinase n=1 Tax=Kutzneria albida DSM 43870 TaxID=1449976 RepID=W5W3G0_9PSEU|nr:histidine kinase [Kutzneria albida]AHH95382.1 two-component system histidine kinase [Kutzneria albida DSM 43870]